MPKQLPDSFWNALEDDIADSEEDDHNYQRELDGLKEILPKIIEDLPEHYDPQTYEGKGGTGVIIGVEDTVLNEYRALKVARPILGMESTVNEILENDFEKLKELSHQNVIDVYYHDSVDFEGRKYPYYVMEYIEGNVEIDEYYERDDITRSGFFESIHSILDAVSYMHERAIIHHDIKPENILVKSDGTPVIVDFGFAKLLKLGSRETPIRGTDEFMHPAALSQVNEIRNPNRIETKISREELRNYGYPWDLWSLGLTFLYIHQSLEEKSSNVLNQYDHKYFRLMACRMLDGYNDQELDNDLDLKALNLDSKVYEQIKYERVDEVKDDLAKLRGTYSLETRVPEINLYSQSTIRVSTITETPFTDRVRELVNDDLVSRLGSIPQLGLMNLLYPAANHSRLEHAIGTLSILTRYVDALYNDEMNPLFCQLMTAEDIRAALVSALVQDIGQYPLAYDLKQAQPSVDSWDEVDFESSDDLRERRQPTLDPDIFTIEILHDEETSLHKIIEDKDFWNTEIDRVVSILRSNPSDHSKPVKDRILHSLIKGPLGAERLDYLTRDSHHIGLNIANAIEFDDFLNSLTIVFSSEIETEGEEYTQFGLGIHEDYQITAETVDFVHYAMLGRAYWHHTHRSIKSMIYHLAWQTFDDQGNIEKFERLVHPIVEPLQTRLGGEDPVLVDAKETSQVHLADLRIIKRLEILSEGDGSEISELLENRELFKRIKTYSMEKTKDKDLLNNIYDIFDENLYSDTSPENVKRFQEIFQNMLKESVEEDRQTTHNLGKNRESKQVTETNANDFTNACEDTIVVTVDIPPKGKALGDKIKFLKEESLRSEDIDKFEVTNFSDQSVGGKLKNSYHNSIGKLRIFCHPDHADFASSYFDREEISKNLKSAISAYNTEMEDSRSN